MGRRLLVFGGGEGLDGGGEFEDLDMGGAVVPIVAPADDDVTAGAGMPVFAEVAALELEFDVDALPSAGADLADGLAIGEAGLDRFDQVTEFLADHTEEGDDALLVDRFVAQATEVHGVAIGWPIFQRRVPKFVRQDEGS